MGETFYYIVHRLNGDWVRKSGSTSIMPIWCCCILVAQTNGIQWVINRVKCIYLWRVNTCLKQVMGFKEWEKLSQQKFWLPDYILKTNFKYMYRWFLFATDIWCAWVNDHAFFFSRRNKGEGWNKCKIVQQCKEQVALDSFDKTNQQQLIFNNIRLRARVF